DQVFAAVVRTDNDGGAFFEHFFTVGVVRRDGLVGNLVLVIVIFHLGGKELIELLPVAIFRQAVVAVGNLFVRRYEYLLHIVAFTGRGYQGNKIIRHQVGAMIRGRQSRLGT